MQCSKASDKSGGDVSVRPKVDICMSVRTGFKRPSSLPQVWLYAGLVVGPSYPNII